jgi:hypothetical protein
MIEPSLALQTAIRKALITDMAFTALIPAANVLDVNQRPSVMPALLIGEGQTVSGTDLARKTFEVYLDFHFWQQETGSTFVKRAVQALREVLTDQVWSIPCLDVADAHITQARFMRDPDTVHSHAIVTLCCRVREYA